MPKETSGQLFTGDLNPIKQRHIYTVSEITQDIKLVLENTFLEVWVEGELSNFTAYPSGHFYFTLKDEKAKLSAVMFNGVRNKDIKFKFENGIKLICFGHLGVYEKEGRYQLYVQKVEPKGIGSLQLALEQLKQKLEKEGLFAIEHKRPIPYLPSRIGIVTSASGAAIKDILKVLDKRFRDIHVILNSVRVQGEGAEEEIAQAIKDFNCYNQQVLPAERIDVLIVGRGGGSVEDLWAFNEEIVARAIYNSQIPIISAVGHERDWTIADLVADMRAPTPSAAAEMVIPEKEDLRERLDNIINDLKRSFDDIILGLQEDLDNLMHRLSLSNPLVRLKDYKERILDLTRQIYVHMDHFFKLKQARFTHVLESLSSLNPLNTLSRGYSITFKMPKAEIIKDAKLVKTGDTIKTRLWRGEIISKVVENIMEDCQ